MSPMEIFTHGFNSATDEPGLDWDDMPSLSVVCRGAGDYDVTVSELAPDRWEWGVSLPEEPQYLVCGTATTRLEGKAAATKAFMEYVTRG